MLTGHNLIGHTLSRKNDRSFKAFSTVSGKELGEEFFEATNGEIDEAASLAVKAFNIYKKKTGKERAEFLSCIADEILALGDELIRRAMLESGLPEARLVGERGRTIAQLQMFAALLQEGSWVNAIINLAIPDRTPLPRSDLRSMLIPVGPVAVFGAANFPLAFSTAGGDTASALAAGCPVIVKAHPAHPGTNEMVAGAILKAAKRCHMPEGVFSSVNGAIEQSEYLAKHPAIKAIGFTGSRNAGLNLFRIATTQRDIPIPVYAEMSSINPVILFPSKIRSEASRWAQMLAGSITQGAGQFCTNPGLLIIHDNDSVNDFLSELARSLSNAAPQFMLNQSICNNYYRKVLERNASGEILQLVETKNNSNNYQSSISLVKIRAKEFIKNKHLQEEIFGPASVAVICKDEVEIRAVVDALEGQLTGTIIGTEEELLNYRDCMEALEEKVGRILFNGVPTGVEVTHAMVHGGPFPSTTNAASTSVGSEAIKRFTRPVCFQDCPESLLPDELKLSNPLNIFRKLNGNYK